MRIIVPSYTRVGSTWVTSVAHRLLQLPKFSSVRLENHSAGVSLNDKEEKQFAEKTQVYKTHSAYPRDFLDFAGKNPDVELIVCKRNFPDSFVSRVLYERYVRSQEGLELSRLVRSVLDTYPDITDAALINLIIEAEQDSVKRELVVWSEMTQTLSSPQVTVINYDKFANKPINLINLLNKKIKAPADVVETTLKATNFKAMQLNCTPGFVRKGVVGDSKNYFDTQSFAWVAKEIQKLNQLKRIML